MTTDLGSRLLQNSATPTHRRARLLQSSVPTLRAELQTAKANVRKGKRLAERWSRRLIAFGTMPRSDWAVLQNHWDGSDVRLVREIQNQSADRQFTMPPLWNNPAHMR